jgi:hypothetical protein
MRRTRTGKTSLSTTLRGACLGEGLTTLSRRLAVGLLGVSFALALPAAAQANNLFTLDPQADTSGPIVTDSSGNGYIAWSQPNGVEADTTLFCKIPRGGSCTDPIVLPLPGATTSVEGIAQAFPVIGTQPGVVYVVAPRYVRNDTLIWSSTNDGESFSAAKVKAEGSYAGDTTVDDVLLAPGGSINTTPSGELETNDAFELASNNVGIGYSFTGNGLTTLPTSFSFAAPGSFPTGATLGLTNPAAGPNTGLVEAYWTLTNPYEVSFYQYPGPGLPVKENVGWTGPKKVTDGYLPRLASGPDGLFMVSQDYLGGESTENAPAVIEVRKYNETSKSFEAPVQISRDPSSGLFEPGDIFENPETGTLYVAWPGENGSGSYVMHLWESTDGGQSFHGEREIATIGYGYSEIPRLAVAADGQGWLTFKDAGGLEVADLTALPAPTPPPASAPSATTLTTTQTSGTSTGASISISAGTIGESDTATITGTNASSATGTVDFALYDNSSCSGTPTFAGAATAAGGVASIADDSSLGLSPGKYYWKAAYAGNTTNDPSSSTCGSEVLTVTPAATIEGKGESTSTTVTLTITCASTPCTVTITITVPSSSGKASAARKSKKKHPKTTTVTLGAGTFTITTKGPHKLTVHLSKAGKKLLAAAHGSLNAKILVAEKTQGGTILTTRTIKITPAKHKHKK